MNGRLALLGRRPVWFTLLVLVLVGIYQIWIVSQATQKIHASGLGDSGVPSDIVVTLAMEPEQFHMMVLQDAGRVTQVKGRRLLLRDVPPDALHALARRYWITTITPSQGAETL